jgi:hypothetical protein
MVGRKEREDSQLGRKSEGKRIKAGLYTSKKMFSFLLVQETIQGLVASTY